MEHVNNFYKTDKGEWYIDLPEWEGDNSALQMVLGADDMLDCMAGEHNEVRIKFADSPFEGSVKMTKLEEGVDGDESFGGATYEVKQHEVLGIPFFQKLWLCDVVKFIFGEMPNVIYFNYAS